MVRRDAARAKPKRLRRTKPQDAARFRVPSEQQQPRPRLSFAGTLPSATRLLPDKGIGCSNLAGRLHASAMMALPSRGAVETSVYLPFSNEALDPRRIEPGFPGSQTWPSDQAGW